ncbi:MAG: aminomethyl-transferring glycine dehydrogenase subunit GcvPA [Deltaproteobacteria bacterium]|nr:aminomethyl-transferring glycine dehydrogenase subunit GcvPA [Deltaproteobacteria bacterium]
MEKKVYPYIPNSAPKVRTGMLREIGVKDVGELYSEIPPGLRLDGRLKIPEPLLSEFDLRRHVESLLFKNKTCKEYINFLGGGCWQHFVPAVCDEINSRGEFLTAYAGGTYSDHGKHQAWFEFQSLLAELIDMDVVGFPTYDWSTAATSSVLMACRLTNRKEIIVPRNLHPEKLSQMKNFCKAAASVRQVGYDTRTGQMDLEDLREKVSSATAAVYFENPGYLGGIESHGREISRIAHANGALSVVGVDPISLGLLAPPSKYGADIVCGDVQPLGVHMYCGGGLCGFIGSRDDERYMAEYPTLLETIGPTEREGEWGFGWATLERTSYVKRELSEDFTGTSTGLWAITAAVYLALLGPQGMRDVGEAIMQKSHYAMKRLATLDGVRAPVFECATFKEFVVNFDDTGRSVKEINMALLDEGIFGGKDLSEDFPELSQSALYCVTEVISKENIDRLVTSLGEVLR